MVTKGKRRTWSGRARPVGNAISAIFRGIVAGLAIIAIYCLVLANIWPQAQFVTYCAFLLVAVATLSTAIAAVWRLRRCGVRNRLIGLPIALFVVMIVLVPASVIRLVPPAQVTKWLADLIDASTPLSKSLADLDPTQAPILGERLVASEIWIILVIEIVLVVALVYLITRLSLRRMLCSTCHSPCEFRSGVVRFAATDVEGAREHIEQRNWTFFRESGDEPTETGPRLRFDLMICPACSSTNTMTVVVEQTGRRDIPVVTNLPLSHEDVRTVEALDQFSLTVRADAIA